jgi:hypothetical protein
MEARVRKIDDALDRLMSGSYGHCVKCGLALKHTELDLDPAIAFCHGVGRNSKIRIVLKTRFKTSTRWSILTKVCWWQGATLFWRHCKRSTPILVGTRNSDYRILLLDPRTGRALVDGGQYLNEPRESMLGGSSLHGFPYKPGAIAVGYRLEMWIGDKAISTSPVRSVSIEHHDAAESMESITAAVQRARAGI